MVFFCFSEMDSNLFDFDYEVYGNGRLFYLNEVVEKVDGRDVGPILKDKHYEMMMVKNRITVLNKAECGNGGTSGVVGSHPACPSLSRSTLQRDITVLPL